MLLLLLLLSRQLARRLARLLARLLARRLARLLARLLALLLARLLARRLAWLVGRLGRCSGPRGPRPFLSDTGCLARCFQHGLQLLHLLFALFCCAG
jgi:hypothetical protein